MPEILKSSRSCTTLSLLGSPRSVFRTWNNNTQRNTYEGYLSETKKIRNKVVCPHYRFQQLDLVQSRFCVMFGTFHNLHCYKALLPARYTDKNTKHNFILFFLRPPPQSHEHYSNSNVDHVSQYTFCPRSKLSIIFVHLKLSESSHWIFCAGWVGGGGVGTSEIISAV